MARKVLEIPKNFQETKLSLEQTIRRFWGTRSEYKEGSTSMEKIESPENLALLYILLTELLATVEKTTLDIGNKLLTIVGEDSKILLSTYGKKVELDTEANWLFIKQITDEEWLELDMQQNKEYMENRLKK